MASALVNKNRCIFRDRKLLCDVGFFEWLPERDTVQLLATCRALRDDDVIATHLLRKLPCVALCNPFKLSNETYNFDPGLYDEKAAISSPNGRDLPRGFLVRKRDQRTKMVSLAALLKKEMEPLCSQYLENCAMMYYPYPFVLALDDLPSKFTVEMVIVALTRLPRTSGYYGTKTKRAKIPSNAEVHWVNMETRQDDATGAPTAKCVFCETTKQNVATYMEEHEAYWGGGRSQAKKALKQMLLADGMEMEQARTQAKARFAERDEFYGCDDDEVETVHHLCQHKKLPLLPGMDGAHTDEEMMDYIAQTSVSDVCSSFYEPLFVFFKKNLIRYVHRFVLAGNAYDNEEIKSVEWIGGVSPGGFLVGVHVMEGYT